MMAGTEHSLMSKESYNFEKENLDKQALDENSGKSLNNEENDDSISSSSIDSAHSALSAECKNNTPSVQLNSWNRHLKRATELKNGIVDCDLCRIKSLQSPGNTYCRYCDKCFCQSCINYHEQLTPEHKVTNLLNPDELTLSDVMPASTCDKHKLPISLFCENCHLCLCVACWEGHYSSPTTSCPPPLSLNLQAKETRTQGLELLEVLNSFKEKAMKQSEFLGKVVSEMTEKSENKCESLWNELEVLFTLLRHKLTLLIAKIETETYHQRTKLEGKASIWKDYAGEIEYLHSELNELLRFANDADLVSTFKTIKSRKEDLNIDQLKSLMNTAPISVEVEYSQEFLNLQHKASKLVIGRTRLTVGDKSDDPNCQENISDQISDEGTNDVGTQCDERDIMQSDSLSNSSFLYDPYFADFGEVDAIIGNSNTDNKSFQSPTLAQSCSDEINIENSSAAQSNSDVSGNNSDLRSVTTSLDNCSTQGEINIENPLENSSAAQSNSDVSGNNSDLSSLTTSLDNCSTQGDLDNTASENNNILSPMNNCDFSENDNKPAQAEAQSYGTMFSPRQLTVLKLWSRWSLSLDKNTYVRGLTVSEDDHIFLCDRSSKKVSQFNADGKLMCRCDVSGIPWDVCAFSNSILFVALPQMSKILLLQRCTGKCLLAVSLAVSTGEKKYASLTKVNAGILACDNDANIDLLDSHGNFLRSITSSMDKIDSSVSHRLCAGLYEDSFWKLNVATKTISCHRTDGELLIYHRIPFKENTSDICGDSYHCVYGCDKTRIYCLTSDGGMNILWTFPHELKTQPRMCVNSKRDKLFVSYQLPNKNILHIFTISPKFEFLENN